MGLDRAQALVAAADAGAQALRTAAVVRLLLHNALRVDEAVLVENLTAGADLGFHAACWYSLISPASLVRRRMRAGGTGKAMTSGASSGARRSMPSPWWLRPVL